MTSSAPRPPRVHAVAAHDRQSWQRRSNHVRGRLKTICAPRARRKFAWRAAVSFSVDKCYKKSAMTKGRATLLMFAPGLVLAAGCGRTELDPRQPCLADETTRSCPGACSDGVQTCVDGYWGRCELPVVTRACASACGPGLETCVDGKWGACDAPAPKPPKLHAVIRDFHATHPDFERPGGGMLDPGLVRSE